jgi:hypothetical protein
MKTKTHFAFRVDIWDDTGDSIIEHVAGVDDFEVGATDKRYQPSPSSGSGHSWANRKTFARSDS